MLADQLVLVQSFLGHMTASQVNTQLKVLEQDRLMDLILPCSMFLALDHIIKDVKSRFLFTYFNELYNKNNLMVVISIFGNNYIFHLLLR